MKNLLIIGARGFGREVYNLAIESTAYQQEYVVKGFLDDKIDALEGYADYPPIVSSVEDYIIQQEDVFICALGDVRYKKKYADIILKKGGEFISLIHPTAYIGKNTKVGKGCIIGYNAYISCDITMGDFVTVQGNTTLGHDVKIGDFCQLNSYTFIGGYGSVENFVTLNTGSIILPHKTVKENSIVGAGSVVVRNVPQSTTVFGMPAIKL